MTTFRLIGKNGKNIVLDVPVKIQQANIPDNRFVDWTGKSFEISEESYLVLEIKISKKYKIVEFLESGEDEFYYVEQKRLKNKRKKQ